MVSYGFLFSADSCKKDTIFDAARKNFGPSYFVMADQLHDSLHHPAVLKMTVFVHIHYSTHYPLESIFSKEMIKYLPRFLV